MDKNNDIKLSITLEELLNEYDEIIVPCLQRDYVMGANDNLFARLIQDLQDKCEKTNNKFDFGCIIGNYSDNKLYIYDGQQRLATLVIMVSLQLGKNKDGNKEYYRELITKFKFEHREEANNLLVRLIEGEETENVKMVDLTTWSIVKTINNLNNIKIDIDKLMKQVIFKCMPIEKKSTAEQLFFDLNEGVNLKDYEIFKSELDMQIRNLVRNGKILIENAEEWFDKIDNEWLDWCYSICKSQNRYFELEKIEEKEMLIILYIIKMIYIENSEKILKDDIKNKKYINIEKFKSFKTIDIEWIQENFNENMFLKTMKLMNTLIKIKNNSSDKEEFYIYVGNQHKYKEYSTRYFNLNYSNHDNWVIDKMIKMKIGTEENNNDIIWTETVNEEILLWVCINLLNVKQGKQEYIRLIKKLLNQNREVNNRCYYYVCDKGDEYEDYIQFSRQRVMGNIDTYDYNLFHLDIINFIKDTIENIDCKITIDYILNFLDKYRNKTDEDKKTDQIEFEDICKKEYMKYKIICEDQEKGKIIILFENNKLFNGIIDNIFDNTYEEYYIGPCMFNALFKYENSLGKREKQARELLSVLQFQSNEVLLYDGISCNTAKSKNYKISIPNKDIIDIMVSSGDKIAESLKEYFENSAFISKTGKFINLAYALGAEKDFNTNKTGRRERLYYEYEGRFRYTRPMHRAKPNGNKDETKAINTTFIKGQNIDSYLFKDKFLTKKCQQGLNYFTYNHKVNYGRDDIFYEIENEKDLNNCFFRLAQNIIGKDFVITEDVIGLLRVMLKTNDSVEIRDKEITWFYNDDDKISKIRLNDKKNNTQYFIKYNNEGKIVILKN